MANGWTTDDGLLDFAVMTTPAQRLEWLESALDFAAAVGALEKTMWLEKEGAISSGHARSDGNKG